MEKIEISLEGLTPAQVNFVLSKKKEVEEFIMREIKLQNLIKNEHDNLETNSLDLLKRVKEKESNKKSYEILLKENSLKQLENRILLELTQLSKLASSLEKLRNELVEIKLTLNGTLGVPGPVFPELIKE